MNYKEEVVHNKNYLHNVNQWLKTNTYESSQFINLENLYG